MDIAKIRKKAKQQESGRPAEDRSSAPVAGNETPAPPDLLPETEPVIHEQIIPVEIQPPHPETVKDNPAEMEPSSAVMQQNNSEQIELLTFRLGREEFAFEVGEIEEIIRLQKMTKVPTLRDYVVGITSLRGKIIPVIELKARLNLKDSGEAPAYATQETSGGDSESKILIIDGLRGFIGAAIDRVMGVVRVAKDSLIEPPAHLSEAETQYIKGIVILEKRFISVLRSEETMNIEIG